VEIFNLLDSSPIVKFYNILDFKAWNTGSYIKIEIAIRDGTFLYAREYTDDKERNYSYHWQNQHGELLLRWDNSPHHKHIKTFPHHKHTKGIVKESTEISLEEVINYIEKHYK
jgi:hypothetical protein